MLIVQNVTTAKALSQSHSCSGRGGRLDSDGVFLGLD